MISITCRAAYCILSIMLVFGCADSNTPTTPPEEHEEDAGSYALVSRYDSIRSYPGGGGIFVFAFVPDNSFAGTIQLSLTAEASLHARLNRTVLDDDHRVAEFTIAPDSGCTGRISRIRLTATHADSSRELSFDAVIYEWEDGEPSMAMEKRARFVQWLATRHPELGDAGSGLTARYLTYPELLIVEHWTFLSDAWEMRVCVHVMVPPDDWSMMLLRRRGEMLPLLAARMETGGSIHEIPVEDYPVMFGY